MNFAAFERAQVAAFAYREGRHTGSIDCMRAVCFILRNRVKSGWGGGSWLAVMEAAGEVAAPSMEMEPPPLANDDHLLHRMARDVDDIYLGQEPFDDRVAQVCVGMQDRFTASALSTYDKKNWKPVLYYNFVDHTPRLWFVENIIRKPQEHPQVGQIGGKMMLYR